MFSLIIPEDVLLVVSGFGFLQGVFLSFLLFFHPRSDKSVTIFLGSYIITLTIVIIEILSMDVISFRFTFFIEPFALLLGPFLYLYVRSFKELITWRKVAPNLIMFILYTFIVLWYLTGWDSSFGRAEMKPETVLRNPATIILAVTKLASFLFYYFVTRHSLDSYQRSIRQLYSETSRINLNWVRWLINGYLSLVIATVILFVLILRYPRLADLWLLINVAIVTPYLYLVTWKGILQPSIWQIEGRTNISKLEKNIHDAEEIESRKNRQEIQVNQRSGLSETRLKEIVSGILTLMENNKLYQEPELTLQQIADMLQYPNYQVSLAINDGMKKNFYDLVNSYRVEEAKRILLNPKSKAFTILSVGFEAGFNSKTTFNTVFKKFTGLTPTEYRDRQKQTSPAS